MIAAPLLWSQGAAFALAPALGDALDEIAAEVQIGTCELWALKNYGLVVTRLEVDSIPGELVLVAGAGRGLVDVVGSFQIVARDKGYSMRIHSRRPGIGRLLCRKLNFRPAGLDLDGFTIYRWSADDGR